MSVVRPVIASFPLVQGRDEGCDILRWRVQAGESFEQGAVLVELRTASGEVDVVALGAGFLTKILVDQHSFVDPGQVLAEWAPKDLPTAYDAFVARVVDDGIVAASKDYVRDWLKLTGAVQGFQACLGKDPVALSQLLTEARTKTHEAHLVQDPDYWHIRCFEGEIEWVCNCVSAMLMNEGLPVIVPPTARGVMRAAEILGFGQMLDVLERAEQALPALLGSLEGWNSLDVNYEPPRVERLWRPFEGDYRLYLHRIHPCEKALYHPHPWPSAIKIVAGGYEMGMGFGSGERQPPLAGIVKLSPGSSYVMAHPDGWHYVLPRVPNLSIMLAGKPWDRWSPGPGPDVKFRRIPSDREAKTLLLHFQAVYPDYSKVKGLRYSNLAALHIDALRRVGLSAKADLIQFDWGTCRLCGLTVSGGHRCWTVVNDLVVWIPDP